MNVRVRLHTCVEDENKNKYHVGKYDCNMMTVLQFSMEFIKTEPDPDAELFLPSCNENQSIDVKVEEKPVFISLPPVDDGNDVSCLPICLLLLITHSGKQLLAIAMVSVCKL